MSKLKIYSGGQSGVDRAALDAAIQLDISHAGWCPKGRIAEDGKIDPVYMLKETESSEYLPRTRRNIEDTDGTLILYGNDYDGGTRYTYDYAKQINKPVLTFDINTSSSINIIIKWLDQYDINTLNIAGPRESKQPGIYNKVLPIISELLNNYCN